MALGKEKSYRSFVKGIITEASPLTFPENASIDEDNFVLKRDGSRARRLGIDYESLFTLTPTNFTEETLASTKVSFHYWVTVGGTTSYNIGVVRVSNKLWFLDMTSQSPSSNLLNGGNPITITELDKADLDSAVLNANLIIVSDDLNSPIALIYNGTTDTVTQEAVNLKVRDIWGVDDGLVIDNRPRTLSNLHAYNLRNQGWSKNIRTDSSREAILDYFNSVNRYPSNADNWTLGRNTNPTAANYERFQGGRMNNNSVGNSPAPKGAHIIDAFNRGSSRLTEANKPDEVSSPSIFIPNLVTLPLDRELGNITSIASYAGRIFYSGVFSNITNGDKKSPNYSNYIFFTQVVTSNDKLGNCYQEADPTSATINDLIDSDGGTVAIPECNQIIKIASAENSLLIFGDNGVWELFGDTNGFVATSFQVAKISNNGVIGSKSIINVGNGFIYWSQAGIYTLTADGGSLRFRADNISLTTIQKLYLQIPETTKKLAKGFYDEKENIIRWLYNDEEEYTESNFPNRYNKELVYDITLQAFYKQSISSLTSGTPYICDYVKIPGFVVTSETSNVLVDTDSVIVTSLDQVVITESFSEPKSSEFSFLTITGTSFTLSKYRSDSYVDWETAGNGIGADYSSYLVTGFELFEDLMRDKTVPYITFYFNRTEDTFVLDQNQNIVLNKPSSCLIQAQWNWADSVNSGRWGRQFQAYRLLRNYIPSGPNTNFDYGESVIVTKHKLRGSGKCLSLKIESEQGKAMDILGWGVTATANNRV
jgi:hypothetical protein